MSADRIAAAWEAAYQHAYPHDKDSPRRTANRAAFYRALGGAPEP
jgi:hypothetical protein